MRNLIFVTICVLSMAYIFSPESEAGIFVPPSENNLFENGDFETGDLTGWQQLSETGSGEWSIYSSQEVGPLPPPPVGEFAAVASQSEPDITALFQDIFVSTGTSNCSAVVYYIERGRPEPPGLTSPPIMQNSFDDGPSVRVVDQQIYRVDIVDPNSNPLDIDSGVLLPIFENDPEVFELGYTLVEFDLSQFSGQSVRFRALTNAFTGPFNGVIDAVYCEAPRTSVPTLSKWGLIAMAGLIGLIGLCTIQRKRARV